MSVFTFLSLAQDVTSNFQVFFIFTLKFYEICYNLFATIAETINFHQSWHNKSMSKI